MKNGYLSFCHQLLHASVHTYAICMHIMLCSVNLGKLFKSNAKKMGIS